MVLNNANCFFIFQIVGDVIKHNIIKKYGLQTLNFETKKNKFKYLDI